MALTRERAARHCPRCGREAAPGSGRFCRYCGRYLAELADWARGHGVRLPSLPPGRESNHHLFALLLPDEAARDRCLQALRAAGIGAAFHYVPLHSSPFARAHGLV